MKNRTLPVVEFRRLVESLCTKADEELAAMRARLDAFRQDVPG